MCSPTMYIVVLIIAVLFIIILLDLMINQRTASEFLNKLSMGLLSEQIAEQNNETYMPVANGARFILPDGRVIVPPPGSRLVNTRSDIILQDTQGGMVVLPEGVVMTMDKNEPSYISKPEKKAAPVQAPAPAVPTPETAGEDAAASVDASVKEGFSNGSREEFNEDLPEQNPIGELTGDYNEDLLGIGLEDQIRQNHIQFHSETNRVTNHAGLTALNDHTNDVVPGYGLTRPDYRVTVDKSARTVPSHLNLDQLPRPGVRFVDYNEYSKTSTF